MKTRYLRNPAILTGLALIAPLSTPSAVRADIIITIAEVGGPSSGPNVVAVGAPSTPGGVNYNPGTATFGDFTISGAGVSESQVPAFSEVLSTALKLTNNSASAHTLTFTIEASRFTAPAAPPGATLISNLGGTTPAVVGTGAGNSISFRSQAGSSPSNATPTQSPDITADGTAYAAPRQTLSIASGLPASGYSVFETYSITLNPGATLQFTGRTDLVPNAVPEPATVAMALTALPLLGIGALARRRRRARA